MIISQYPYLGIAEAYPLCPDPNSGIKLVADTDLIKQSINDSITTPIGTQYPNENYGSYLYKLVHQPNDAILYSLIYFHVSETLDKWEKRIRVYDIFCTQDAEMSNKIWVSVHYVILASNEIDSFVFPFFKELKT